MLSQPDLFARLAEGHTTVVTPNRRLAQTLMAQFDAFQIARDLAVWEAPDILPFGAFVERLWDDAFHSVTGGEDVPLLLTAAQEQAIWEDILAGSNLLSIPQTAAQCRDAWRLAHAWRIAPGGGGEDAQAFRDWAKSYDARTRDEVDAARLPDVVLLLLEKVAIPDLCVAYAFDIIPPQTREFFSRLP